MKILVFSDSHASLHFMRDCVKHCKPNGIIHLGDYYDDATVIHEENPGLPFQQVPGNCDEYRKPIGAANVIQCSFGGVRFFMTHGHIHHVKTGIGALLADARRGGAQIALYGHTHETFCQQQPDGLWVLNPGSCGCGGRTAGLIEIRDKEIVGCRIITQTELEAGL